MSQNGLNEVDILTWSRGFSLPKDESIDFEAFPASYKLNRFYLTFFIFAVLISVLAGGALTFEEFHPTDSRLIRIAEALLCCAEATAIITGVVSLMLCFRFEAATRIPTTNLLVTWSPLALLDFSLLEFLAGLGYWYCSKSSRWAGEVMVGYLAFLLLICGVMSAWILGNWFIKDAGCLSQRKRD